MSDTVEKIRRDLDGFIADARKRKLVDRLSVLEARVAKLEGTGTGSGGGGGQDHGHHGHHQHNQEHPKGPKKPAVKPEK